MRAWLLEKQAQIEERPLNLGRVPTPHPKDDEMRLKNLVCGVCRTDLHIAEGDLALKKSPVVLGHEIVGVVDEVGQGVTRFNLGDRVGVCWLHSSCKRCKHCLLGRENYCPEINCTGWDVDGGYAEYCTIPEAYAISLNDVSLEPFEIAPLLCPGIAGYAALELTGLQDGSRLGLYGFGPTAYFVLIVAQSSGIETYVSTRSSQNIENARAAGATWAADAAKERMPVKLDAAIIFPPAGNLVEPALSQVEKGGTLVLAPVSLSPIVIKEYSENLWGRSIKTLYHLKRSDAEGFFRIISGPEAVVGTTLFPFEEVQDALILVKQGKLKQPSAVIKIANE